MFVIWFLAFWLNFATLLNVSLRWLQTRPLLAVLFGVLGGPPAYLGAQHLGALELATPTTHTMALLAVYWGIATPAVLRLAHWLNPDPDRPNRPDPNALLEGSTS